MKPDWNFSSKLCREAEGEGAPGAAPDLSFMPEEYRGENGPDFKGFSEHYTQTVATAARWEEQMGKVPEGPGDYKFELPEIDYKSLGLPEDFGLELDPEHEVLAPVLEKFGGLLHQYHIPAEGAAQFMELLGTYEALTQKATIDARGSQAEQTVKDLGANGQTRIDAARRSLETRLPAALVKGLEPAFGTADGIKAIETLLTPRNSGNPPPGSGNPRDALAEYYAKPT